MSNSLCKAFITTVILLTPYAIPRVGAQSAGTNDNTPSTTEAAQSDDAPDLWRFHWRNHPEITFGDIATIEMRSRISLRTDVDRKDGTASDLDHRRVGVQGTLWKALAFEIDHELGDANPWRDVFVNYRAWRQLQVQSGHFKIPFSRDRTTSAGELELIDRSLAADGLAPGRATGVMAHGRIAIVNYEAGVFRREHDRPDAGDTPSAGRLVAARLVMQPFRGSKSIYSSIEVGAAYMGTRLPTSVADVTGRSFSGLDFFPSGIWVNGTERRFGLESRWRPGPLSFGGEYMRVTNERLGQSLEGNDLPSLVAEGWYTGAAWTMTGERDPHTPARPLFRGGIGAVGLAMRLEQMSIGSAPTAFAPSTSPRADTILDRRDIAMTTGVNWYPNRWIKVQANLIRESFRNVEERSTPQWSRAFNVLVSL